MLFYSKCWKCFRAADKTEEYLFSISFHETLFFFTSIIIWRKFLKIQLNLEGTMSGVIPLPHKSV